MTLTNVTSGDGAIRIGDITMKRPSNRPMIVCVSLPDGSVWQRSFGGEWFDDESESCLFTTPSPIPLGLRIRGRGFVVDVHDPDHSIELSDLSEAVLPVAAVASGHAEKMPYLATFLQVFAFDGYRFV